MNRAVRVGSASTNYANGNYYNNRRPTVVFKDEQSGVTEKSSGAQARVNQRFVRTVLFLLSSSIEEFSLQMSSLRPNSAADLRAKTRSHSTSSMAQTPQPGPSSASAFGSYATPSQRRSQMGHYSNMTSTMMARDTLGGYNQQMGTITQSGLRVIDGLLHQT